MKKIFLFFVGLFLIKMGLGQTTYPISLSTQSLQPSAPGQQMGEFFKSPLHAGITAGTAFSLNKDSTHQLLQTAKVGYFYHRDLQKAVQLYSEFTYRFQFAERWSAAARLGAGYLHAFPDFEVFTLQSDGTYQQKSKTGRPQLMGTTSVGLQYQLDQRQGAPIKLMLEYQFFMQYPFVNQYIPLLPYTALHVGVQFPISLNKAE